MPVAAVETLRRVFGKKPEISHEVPPTEPVQPAGSPEVINIEKHCLRYHSGFPDFAKAWNEHVNSPARVTLEEAITAVRSTIAALPNENAPLKKEADRLRVERDSVEEAGKEGVRKANQRFSRANNKFDTVSHREQKLRLAEKDRLARAKTVLTNSDLEFGLALDQNRADFFAAERLRDDQKAVDKFFLGYCARKELDREARELVLDLLNFCFISLRKYYTEEKVDYVEERRQADKATERQLRLIGVSRRF